MLIQQIFFGLIILILILNIIIYAICVTGKLITDAVHYKINGQVLYKK